MALNSCMTQEGKTWRKGGCTRSSQFIDVGPKAFRGRRLQRSCCYCSRRASSTFSTIAVSVDFKISPFLPPIFAISFPNLLKVGFVNWFRHGVTRGRRNRCTFGPDVWRFSGSCEPVVAGDDTSCRVRERNALLNRSARISPNGIRFIPPPQVSEFGSRKFLPVFVQRCCSIGSKLFVTCRKLWVNWFCVPEFPGFDSTLSVPFLQFLEDL